MYISVSLLLLMTICECVRDVYMEGMAYMALRPFLRKPKVRNRITREERKRRSAFSKQLHKELRMKYWERVNPNINTIITYPEDDYQFNDIDPKRGFVVQELIPRLVTITKEMPAVSLPNRPFDRNDALSFLTDIKAVLTLFVENFRTGTNYRYLYEMGPSEQLDKLQNDVYYIRSLLNVDESAPSKLCLEYLSYLDDIDPIRFLSNAYVFYKEWHLCKGVILPRLRSHLKLVRKFRSNSFDSDCINFERVLNLIAQHWTRQQKNIFLNELNNAYNKLSVTLLNTFT